MRMNDHQAITREEAQAHVDAVMADPSARYEPHCPHCAAAFQFGLWAESRSYKDAAK